MKGLIIAAIIAASLVAPPTTPAYAAERIVYVYVIKSFNDGLYHKLGCCSLYGQSVKAMTRRDAQKEHRRSCDWCHPDSAHKKGQR